MYPQRRMVRHSLRLGLLVTLVVLALSACGGEKQQVSKPQPLPEEQQQLRTGVYRSEEFKPSLTFRVGEGWSNLPPEAIDTLFIVQGETRRIGFVGAWEVYKPTKTGALNAVEAPEDMVGWFQEHPYLQTDKPEPVTVGGVKGVQVDVVVEDLPEAHLGVCGSECVDLFANFSTVSALPVFLVEGDKMRLIVLEEHNLPVPRTSFVGREREKLEEEYMKGFGAKITYTSPATEFDEFAPEAQEVIDSVEWTGS
jgi:hypothetical protein